MLGRFQSKISKKQQQQQQREEKQQHEERQQQEQQQQDISNLYSNPPNNNNNNKNNNNTSNNMPDFHFSSYSNQNNFMPALSTDEMVSKNKIFSVSPRKKQNKMTQLASLATSFNSNVNINSSNFKNTLHQQNDNKNYYVNTGDKNNDNNTNYSNSSISSFPSTPAVATPTTTTLPYFHNVGTRSNSVIAGQTTNSSSLIAPRTTTAQFIEQQQQQQNAPSTPIPNDSSATPAFYNHKYQNSVTSFASSIDDNTPIGNFPPLFFTTAFIKLLLETYQLHCQDPTVTPFDENNPPYGVTNIVSKNALKKAIKTKINLTINPNPLELGNNANVLAAIRKQLLQEVKKDASLYQSRNNSIISLSNVSVGMGTNTSETWSNPIIANQIPISSFKQPNYNEGNTAPTPLMNNSMARPSNDLYSYNTHPAFQSQLSENQSTIVINGLNSSCELTSHGNNDLLSPLEPISQQNHHQGYYQQQQQQQDLVSGAPFMKPSFRSRNNSLLNDLTRTRSNGSPFLYNAPTSGSAGSALSSGMSSHNIHLNYNNQSGSQQSTPSNTQDYFSSTRNFNTGKREKAISKSKDSFTFN